MELFVTHPICDAARNLRPSGGATSRTRARSSTCRRTPPRPRARDYLRRRVRPAARRCARPSPGGQITDDDLRASIAVFNRNRALLRELYAIKRETPWQVAMHEAYALVALGGLMPREEHNELLEAVLPLLRAREREAARPGARRVRGRLLRAAAVRPDPRDRPLVLRRGRRPADRPALDPRGRAGGRRPAGGAGVRPTSSARATARCSTTRASPRRTMLLERVKGSARAGRDRRGREDVRARASRSRWPTCTRSTRRSCRTS